MHRFYNLMFSLIFHIYFATQQEQILKIVKLGIYLDIMVIFYSSDIVYIM